jgi:malate permease and related proteins
MIILNSLESILSIFIMIYIGYFLCGRGWFNEDTGKLFSRIVMNISLPPMMLSNMMTSFDKEKLAQSGIGLFIPFASMIICYFIGKILVNTAKIRPERHGLFEAMFFASNTIFMGLPINLALFGEKSVPYVLLYYIANTTLFWTIGIYSISKTESSRILSLETVKRVFSPPLLGFLAAIVFILLNMKLPLFVMDTCKYLGNLTTPLSMMFVGITLYSINVKDIKVDKDMTAILLGRFLLGPLVVLLLGRFIPVPALMKKVFVIQASMPVITQCAIVSRAYKSDYKFAAVAVTLSTLASIIFIPLYMEVLNYLF